MKKEKKYTKTYYLQNIQFRPSHTVESMDKNCLFFVQAVHLVF